LDLENFSTFLDLEKMDFFADSNAMQDEMDAFNRCLALDEKYMKKIRKINEKIEKKYEKAEKIHEKIEKLEKKRVKIGNTAFDRAIKKYAKLELDQE